MYTILVYDTATERNAAVLRTCRKYLRHQQRSVFEGELSPAQMLRLRTELEQRIDRAYDHILVYTFPPGTDPRRQSWGGPDDQPHDIL
ncbi:CRISPR-associated protein Cas2 [Actinoalloteichus hoggarensis]|uniref:CRISPR-associated endoribonuclease Cas2 n=1 Tax=Actinoalloteichus hoggarensis TaxID=1470176 RepID=A0A221W8B9_9PSEU|nr:CRISPR-associated endonuclease Cas2 [Actinoalloteichus hoggarensis]ASO21587.1 CRISPR-associated endoribonuclease Cas2 [Actinoalloteichus hoggarensis]MBB5922179.1 CRISPR-associated protein Cas2 [Actinoalloteichus hoggarensis]